MTNQIRRLRQRDGVSEFELLSNGLKILLRPSATAAAPVAIINVIYHVGSRNEAVGHTGATHLLEHMLFKGTEKFDPVAGNGVMEICARIGGANNANTWFDRTNYYECVPTQHLKLAIEIEADRMRHLLLRPEDLATEMTVVRNELERGENDPAGVLDERVWATAFREHPYHHPTIGWRSDVEGVSLERLKEFYDTYYHPNNATVIVVGSFDEETVLAQIEEYFGVIPRSAHEIPPMYTVEPPQEGEHRFTLNRAGDRARLHIAFHTPEALHASDIPALYVLHMLLGGDGDRASRFSRLLIDKGLATECSTSLMLLKDPGLFSVQAAAGDGISLQRLERNILKELERSGSKLFSAAEIGRAIAANRKGTQLISADQMRFCSVLAEAVAMGDWAWLFELDALIESVTPEDVRRVAERYFVPSNRTVGYFVPSQGSDTAPVKITDVKPRSIDVSGLPTRVVTPNRVALQRPDTGSIKIAQNVKTVKLPNGVTLLLYPTPGSGTVAIRGRFGAGRYHGELQGARYAPVIIAETLTSGSRRYTQSAIARKLKSMGSSLSFSSLHFATSFGAHVVASDLPDLLDILADALQHPQFADKEVALSRQQLKAGIDWHKENGLSRAVNAFRRRLYPVEHPFGARDFDAQAELLAASSAEQVRQFYAANYGAASTVIALCGDFDPDQVEQQLSRRWAGWSGDGPAKFQIGDFPALAELGGGEALRVNLPDKASADILFGHPTSFVYGTADYYAALIATGVLGGSTLTGRLGKSIRVKHGLTYGVTCNIGDICEFGDAPWMVSMTVNPANVERALELSREVIAEWLEHGITEDELADEVSATVGDAIVGWRSPSGICSSIVAYAVSRFGLAGLDSFADRFYSLTKAEVDAAIRRHFHPERLLTVVAGTLQ